MPLDLSVGLPTTFNANEFADVYATENGDMLYQPATHHQTVAAYRYRGSTHDVITIVGTNHTPRQVDIRLCGEQDGPGGATS